MPNQDQINSLVRTGLKIAGSICAAHGGQEMATILNTSDVAQLVTGIILAGVGIYASHQTHKTPTPMQGIGNP